MKNRIKYFILKKINNNEYLYWCKFSGYKTKEQAIQAIAKAKYKEPKAIFIIEKHTIEIIEEL